LAWHGGLQRSITNTEPQLILDIIASSDILDKLKAFTKKNDEGDESYPLFDLFEKINEISLQSGHPFAYNQIGWARLELNKEERYILVDEIQSDHMNACKRLTNSGDPDISKLRDSLCSRYNLDIVEFNSMIDLYKKIISDFPAIANEAIIKFAKNNKYIKLFWHTLESGKKFKKNSPPASLYSDIPKKHFYSDTNEKPFGLESSFMMRMARYGKLLSIKYGKL